MIFFVLKGSELTPNPLINLLQSRVSSVLLLHLFKMQKQLILFVRKERPRQSPAAVHMWLT